jgi:putative FmdB family regulatory protein
MPVYEFRCETCGSFEHWRPFEAAADPMTCPVCNAVARRVYSLPGIYKTPTALAGARARAEKSAYEPEVAVRERPPSEEPRATRKIVKRSGPPWLVGD